MYIISMSAPTITIFFVFCFFSVLVSPSFSAFVAPIWKDLTTRQYTISVYLKTPLQSTELVLDLGASFSWVDCTQNYTSTTYHNIPCDDPLCQFLNSRACSVTYLGPQGPGRMNNSCAIYPENSVTRGSIIADAIVDTFALPTTDGRVPGQLDIIPEFIFSCSDAYLLTGLAKGVSGLAGLGRSNYSLPAQMGSVNSSSYLFALCLSGSQEASGVAFFNTDGPYYFSPGIDLSQSLSYTPLLLNPVSLTQINYDLRPWSDEYFINITSIEVNGKPLKLNQTLLTIDENGFGGTRISTVVPFTMLQTSILKAFTKAFVKESAALNLSQTRAVHPFSVCYEATDVSNNQVGPAVPTIDLVMENKDIKDSVYWRIFGANSMVRINRKDADLWCLGFVDGGENPRTSIVIGGQQLEDNLLQFDIESKRLGFSSSVLVQGTTCANFNLLSK